MIRCACLVLCPVFVLGCGSSHSPAGDGGTDASIDGSRTDTGTDGDGGGDFRACERNSDCIVVPESCCGTCGAATRGDAIALHERLAEEYRDLKCAGMGCPECAMVQDPTLVATCGDTGQCQVVDLHEHEAAQCTEASDCALRSRDCCECGGDTSRAGLIAIRTDSEGAYTTLVCDGDTDCPGCAPVYPDEADATCAAEGYCQVEWSMP